MRHLTTLKSCPLPSREVVYSSIEVMNVFIRVMVRIFHELEVKNGTFHLSLNENILTITRIETFIIRFIYHQKQRS